MNRSIRRGLTVTGSAIGALALFTGTASAHYCYTTKGTDGNKANGQAWSTAQQTVDSLAMFLPPGDCLNRLTAHIHALGEQGALFMDAGVLASGAAKKDQLPDGMGHLIVDAMAMPECASLLAEE